MVYYALQLCGKAFEYSQIWSFRFYQEENNKIFTIPFWDTLHLTFLKLHSPARLWPQ